MQGQAIGDRAHAEFAHAVVDVVGVRVGLGDRLAGLPLGQVGWGQVGRAADDFRQQRGKGADRVLRSLARGDGRAFGLDLGDEGVGLGTEIGRQFAAHAPAELGGGLRMLLRIAVEQLPPLGLALLAGFGGVPAGPDLLWHLERRMRPVQGLAHAFDLILAQRRAVRLLLAGLVRCAEADHGLRADQAGLVGHRQRRLDRGLDRRRVVAVDIAHHVPAVGLEARRGVVAEPVVHFPIDGDAVVVPERGQLAQAPGAGQRGGLVRHALHHAAVAHEHPAAMVDQVETFAVVALGQQLLGQGEAHGIGQALPQRAGGGLHARGFVALGVAGGAAVQLAEALELVQWQVVATQVQQRVVQHRAVAVGQHEAVAVDPVRVGRIVPQVVVPQHLGDVGHAHRHARMAGVGGLDRVGGKEADGVGELAAGRAGHVGADGVRERPRRCGPPIVPSPAPAVPDGHSGEGGAPGRGRRCPGSPLAACYALLRTRGQGATRAATSFPRVLEQSAFMPAETTPLPAATSRIRRAPPG